MTSSTTTSGLRTALPRASAGATRSGPFLDLSDELWQEGFDLKFFGAVRLSRLFWPQLSASRGSVIQIVGGMARTPVPNFAIGGAVNAALANFGKALAGPDVVRAFELSIEVAMDLYSQEDAVGQALLSLAAVDRDEALYQRNDSGNRCAFSTGRVAII